MLKKFLLSAVVFIIISLMFTCVNNESVTRQERINWNKISEDEFCLLSESHDTFKYEHINHSVIPLYTYSIFNDNYSSNPDRYQMFNLKLLDRRVVENPESDHENMNEFPSIQKRLTKHEGKIFSISSSRNDYCYDFDQNENECFYKSNPVLLPIQKDFYPTINHDSSFTRKTSTNLEDQEFKNFRKNNKYEISRNSRINQPYCDQFQSSCDDVLNEIELLLRQKIYAINHIYCNNEQMLQSDISKVFTQIINKTKDIVINSKDSLISGLDAFFEAIYENQKNEIVKLIVCEHNSLLGSMIGIKNDSQIDMGSDIKLLSVKEDSTILSSVKAIPPTPGISQNLLEIMIKMKENLELMNEEDTLKQIAQIKKYAAGSNKEIIELSIKAVAINFKTMKNEILDLLNEGMKKIDFLMTQLRFETNTGLETLLMNYSQEIKKLIRDELCFSNIEEKSTKDYVVKRKFRNSKKNCNVNIIPKYVHVKDDTCDMK